MEMEDPSHGHHGNFPHRQATTLPPVAKSRAQLALEAMSSETGYNPATTTEERSLPVEQLSSARLCEMDGQPPSEKRQHPDESVAALLKRIRIHPEAQRILGSSCVAVVSLERLNIQSVSSLQPVVSLVRLPSQTRAELSDDASRLDHLQQNGFEEDILAIKEETPQSKPAESRNLTPPQTAATSWTAYCPEGSPSGEPELDSSFGCESSLDQPYIVLDCGSDEWDHDGKTETFYLDPDPELTMVIELDPEPEADRARTPRQKDEAGLTCEGPCEDRSEESGPPVQEVEAQEPEAGAASGEMDSEDFCGVCLNGGELLCCDRCPKVYHLACHIPPLISFPLGDWACTLCRADHEAARTYDCESAPGCGGVRAPYTLSNQDQRRCEKLTLLLYCNLLSAPFHEPVSPLARNYYQIIKRPIDLSVIRRKLDESNTLHYFTAEQFVDDVLLMFKNCATFNYPDSEVAQAGQNLEVFFLNKLREIFPERTFPSASRDRMDRARLQWLSRKRKENCRRKRCVYGGKKYCM